MSDKNQDGSEHYQLSQFQKKFTNFQKKFTNTDLGLGLGFLDANYKWKLLGSGKNENYRIN